MVPLDAFQLPKMCIQVGCPIIKWNKNITLLTAHQLSYVAVCGLAHNFNNVIKAVNLGSTIKPLHQAKAPVRGEFGMPSDEKGQCN
jgi:hypothetical protein